MFRTTLKLAGRAAVLVAGGSVTVAGYKYNTDPGLRRTMDFSYEVLPMCAAYGWVSYASYASKEEKDAALETLHKKYAPEALRVVLAMKGYYIKAAQMMCGVGILPSAYEEEFKILLDTVPPRDVSLIRSTIEQELGAGAVHDVFETFSDDPIGAASIGQAHRATLKGSGHPVVVKVQYPEVESYFHLDLQTIRMLTDVMLPGQDSGKMFDEVAKSFESEFDYRLEAQNLRVCSSNLERAGFGSKAFIPKPVDGSHALCPKDRAGEPGGLCTKRVMVMDAVPGKAVKKVMKQVFADVAEARGLTVDELMSEMKAEFEDPVKLKAMLSRPPPSEFVVRLGQLYLGLRDLSRNALAAGYNCTVGLVSSERMAYKWTTIPPNGPALTRVLPVTLRYEVHGHQVFIDGRFNADPHAGNVMIAEDGRLGLIDYGNTPTLSLQERLDVAALIVALSDNDDGAILRSLDRMGFSVKGVQNDGGVAHAVRALCAPCSCSPRQRLNGSPLLRSYTIQAIVKKLLLMSAYGDFDQRYGTPFFNEHFGFPEDAGVMETMEWLSEHGKGLEVAVPSTLINFQRCVMTLNGVATATGAGNVMPSAMWRSQAKALLARHATDTGGERLSV